MQFLVIAHDGSDDGALERRLAVRERHLASSRTLHEDGVLVVGGALLDGSDRMIGSAMVMEAESEDALRALLESDPYRGGGVWQRFEIWPFRRAF